MDPAYQAYLAEGEQAGLRYALSVPRHVPSGLAGIHLGQRAGASLEFKDHRDYQPGDDLRFIDWQAYARSDRLTVKLYREEVNPHLDLLLDGSASMALTDSAKPRAALGLAAAIITAANNAGYSHMVHLAGQGCHRLPQGDQPPRAWEGIRFEHTESLVEALGRMPPTVRPQGIRILISDLLFMGDPVTTLEQIVYQASATYVVQVLAEADVDPPQRGNVRLVDSESGELQEVFVDAAAQKRYRDNLARHQDHWQRACTQVGAHMTTLVAERLVRDWDLGELVAAQMLNVA